MDFKPQNNKDNYTKIRNLGRGAFGDVSLVIDKNSRKKFALKMIEKQLLTREQKQHQAYVERTVLTELRHPNMINMVQSFQDNKYLYYVLDYCQGGSLSEYLQQLPNHISQESVQFYIAQIINILQYIHSMGVVHRDLKPENIMFTAERHIKLIDFGTALIMDNQIFDPRTLKNIELMKNKIKRDSLDGIEPMRNKATFVGTCEYVSPELLKDDECQQPADVWALGCIIYKMFTGKTPFHDQTEYLIFQRIQEVQYDISDKIPPIAMDLLQKILVRYPSQRITLEQMKKHQFFQGIEFENLHMKEPPRQILFSGPIQKLSGWIFYKNRKLILYDTQILEYSEPQGNVVKGVIKLTQDTIVEAKDDFRWQIQTPTRTYYFKVNTLPQTSEQSTCQWVKVIKKIIKNLL